MSIRIDHHDAKRLQKTLFSSLTFVLTGVRVQKWIAASVLAGISWVAQAQSASRAAIPEVPLAPQAQVDGRGISPNSPSMRILQDQQLLFTSRFYMRGWDRGSVGPAIQSSNDEPGARMPLARFDSHDRFVSGALSGDALDLAAARSPSIYADAAGRSRAISQVDYSEDVPGTSYKASSYVPLDSWIYEAFDRLAAMGYLPTSSATIRPWTRLECGRLLAEVHDNTDSDDETPEPMLAALDAEFAHESNVINGTSNLEAKVESVYGRFTGVSGTALRDSFHFGQTIADDFGRPYGQGANEYSGFSVRAEAGPFAIYLRGEHQYASAMPTYSVAAQQAISTSDSAYVQGVIPFGWNLRFGTTDRLRPVEAYASANFANWQISFGQQALWWGPDRSTSLILSNNAEAMPMLRIARAKPIKVPGVLGFVGPVHFDFFFSREGGVHYVGLGPEFILHGSASQALTPPPYMWGVAFSVKPTANFELGFAHTTIFAGYGRPLNLKTFLHTFSINGNVQAVDPGKRTTEFNAAYHPPGLRRVVVYNELYAYDNPIAGRFLAFYAMDPGIYIPKIPGLRQLDIRMEGVYTNLPGEHDAAYFYANAHYPQGYTNYGQILGSWIGRQGDGGKVSSSYWFSARNKATFSYRKMTSDKSFLQGGNLSDISGNMTWMVRSGIELSAVGQFEHWKFPLLSIGPRSNFTTTLEVRIFPKARIGSE
ncbi:MAG: capsule assembly Wzi family protein [Terracidiphilus sp.]